MYYTMLSSFVQHWRRINLAAGGVLSQTGSAAQGQMNPLSYLCVWCSERTSVAGASPDAWRLRSAMNDHPFLSRRGKCPGNRQGQLSSYTSGRGPAVAKYLVNPASAVSRAVVQLTHASKRVLPRQR